MSFRTNVRDLDFSLPLEMTSRSTLRGIKPMKIKEFMYLILPERMKKILHLKGMALRRAQGEGIQELPIP